jgi:hypothetical protein
VLRKVEILAKFEILTKCEIIKFVDVFQGNMVEVMFSKADSMACAALT